MSNSLLYHAFNIKSVKYCSSSYIGNTIILNAEMTDRKFNCPECQATQHTFSGRKSRMLHLPPVGRKRCVLKIELHRLCCAQCSYKWWPRLCFMTGSKRYTRSFALTALDLLQFGTIQAVARYLQVGWDMIKDIHKTRLQARYKTPQLKDLVYLGIDEFSIRKGHTYLTIFVDLHNGRIVHAVEGRSVDAITPFLKKIARRAPRLKAVAIDMSHSYRKAIQEQLPCVEIVYDRYHISALINRAIDDLRREEHQRASSESKSFMKGSRYLLLRNYENLDPNGRHRLQSLLSVNHSLLTMYTMKEQLHSFWHLATRQEALSFLYNWCFDALNSGIKQLVKIGMTLYRHQEGLLGYFTHRITNAVTEGLNNKIKTLKRQAYGFRDMEYFKLRLYHLHTQRYALSG